MISRRLNEITTQETVSITNTILLLKRTLEFGGLGNIVVSWVIGGRQEYREESVE